MRCRQDSLDLLKIIVLKIFSIKNQCRMTFCGRAAIHFFKNIRFNLDVKKEIDFVNLYDF